MPNREKVIKGFECCHVMVHDIGQDKTSCGICPYKDVQTEEQIDLGGIECIAVLHDDALSLLKEQETTFEKDGHHIRCTSCGNYWCDTDREGNLFPHNYCPECGRAVKWE